MTASSPPTAQRIPLGIRREIRERYAAGTGPSLNQLAMQFRVPHATLYDLATREGWDADELPHLQVEIRQRAEELARSTEDFRADRVRARLQLEFGTRAQLPSLVAIRRMFPKIGAAIRHAPGERAPAIPIHGLRRRCYAPGCGAITTANPCSVCGAAVEEPIAACPDGPEATP